MAISYLLPANDSNMDYKIGSHRYILTASAIENEFGISLAFWLGDAKKIPFFVNQISRQIYSFIYQHHFAENKLLIEWALAREINWRSVIQEAMLAQVEYALISGGNLVSLQTGFSPEKGIMADLNKISNLQLAIQAQQNLAAGGMLYSNSPVLRIYTLQFLGQQVRVDY